MFNDLRMRRWPLAIVPVLGLMGCFGSTNAGAGLRLDPLPVNVALPCPHPAHVIQTVRNDSVGADEIRLGRLGDALLECSAEKEIAVTAYKEARKALTGER